MSCLCARMRMRITGGNGTEAMERASFLHTLGARWLLGNQVQCSVAPQLVHNTYGD